MINSDVFLTFMLAALGEVHSDLKPTPEDLTSLKEQVTNATTAQERVDAFNRWVKALWKAQVTP